jgi:hypothetical protein
LESLKGRDHLEDTNIDLRILKWILNKLIVRVQIELTCLRIDGIKNLVMNLWVS